MKKKSMKQLLRMHWDRGAFDLDTRVQKIIRAPTNLQVK